MNRPFCARPVADAAALYCARQGHLVSRLVTTGWAVVVSPPPGLCSRRYSSVSGCRMRCGASVTCAPLRRHQIACFSRACRYPAAALLCHLGPLLHFRKSASGCCQPTPAGGPLAADLSNRTRRASRQYPAPPGPTRCRGVPGNLPTAPGPHSARWPGRAVRSCSCSWVAASQACCGRPGTNAGPLLRAGAACKPVASDRRLGARPRQNGSCRYARYRSTDARGLRLVYAALPSTTTALA